MEGAERGGATERLPPDRSVVSPMIVTDGGDGDVGGTTRLNPDPAGVAGGWPTDGFATGGVVDVPPAPFSARRSRASAVYFRSDGASGTRAAVAATGGDEDAWAEGDGSETAESGGVVSGAAVGRWASGETGVICGVI